MGWRVWTELTEFSEGNGVEWKAMERGGMFVGERVEVDGGGLGGLLRVFGKEVLGRCCESWADDCASDEQSALNNSYHSVHSVLVILKGVWCVPGD